MRWFCVAPGLPAKASLRIRTAPHSDAPVCGRVSKGKIIGALSDVFEIATESGEVNPEDGTRWLHVSFPEESSGEWIEGFVMANLPDGMTLLVPWEDGDFLSCCTVANERAILYDGPSEDAAAVGTVNAGEGTRFPYGIREVVGTRSRILHDVHERVWVDAADIQIVCERLSHPNCKAQHSFYVLNEDLPQEAQIAIRAFPSRDAETLALLSRGQVIEVATRCGSWLRVAGQNDVWIMWQTDTWQLLTELPFHSSDNCEASELYEHQAFDSDITLSNDLHRDHCENHDMEVEEDDAATTDQSIRARHDSSVGASKIDEDDIAMNAADTTTSNYEEEESTIEHHLVPGTITDQPNSANEDIDMDFESHATGMVDTISSKERDPELSWDDRPIAPMKTAVSEPEPSWDDRPIAPMQTDMPEADPSWDDRPIAPMKAATEESDPSWDDRPIAPMQRDMPEADPSWDDRPIAPMQRDMPEADPSWDDRPIAPMKAATEESDPSWDDRPIAPMQTDMPEADPSWDDRPIAPMQRDMPEADPSWDDRPIAPMKAATEESDPSWDDRPIAPMKAATEESDPSWDDRPIAPMRTAARNAGRVQAPVTKVMAPKAGMPLGEAQIIPAHSADVELCDDGEFGTENHGVDLASKSRDERPRHFLVDKRDHETIPNDSMSDENAEGESITCANKDQLWHWEEAPIKSRHALNKTREGSSNHMSIEPEKPESNVDGNLRTIPVETTPQNRSDTIDTIEVPRSPPGAVAADASSVVWHSSDTGEDPWLFDDSDDLASDSGMFPPDRGAYEENQGRVSLPLRMPFSRRVYENREEEKVGEDIEDIVTKELQSSYEALSTRAVNEDHHVDSGTKSSGCTHPDEQEKPELKNGVTYQLEDRLQRLSSHHRGYDVFKAIVLSEGPDAILEALAKYDDASNEDMLAYSPPAVEQHSPAVSPSGSETELLDVLYSRDHTDPYSTPKKRPETTAQAHPVVPNSVESAKERLASILRRTPRTAKDSHSIVITSSNPEEILQAEFGSCSDELGLFGDYHYPVVSASSRFMNGHAWTPSRGMADGGSVLQSPSFTVSSFSSPLPKENPLKRSAAAIAKTPPVVVRSLSASTAVAPPAPEAVQSHTLRRSLTIDTSRPTPTTTVEQASVSTTVQSRQESRATSGPALTRAKTTTSVGPQARIASPSSLPRSSLAAPSQLRRPTMSSLASPAPGGTRARSFTEEGKPITPPASSAASSGTTRPSLLPRKSMLPAPSPTRFGISRTNSATSTLGKPSLSSQTVDKPQNATATGTTTQSLLTRRTSFGFARPAGAKK